MERDKKGRFVKGHKTYSFKGMNKGMHCSPNSEFKKGEKSWNYKGKGS